MSTYIFTSILETFLIFLQITKKIRSLRQCSVPNKGAGMINNFDDKFSDFPNV